MNVIDVIIPIITAILGAFIYHLFAIRREKKKTAPYKIQRKDTIRFLELMRDSEKNQAIRNDGFLDRFKEEVGQYRLNRILPALERMEIVKGIPVGNGDTKFAGKSKFHSYTQEDIDHLIKSVKQGVYDQSFSVDQ